ncbi:MAG: aminotransferase class I/II-fold pyridoxal phosphate-dependent enzyme [Chloroflexi bacterium]|nr:aminotransferase class I/II-fold pyridoxal phosphate-dependent enzyme [Chloroflexota bacterium]
MNRLPWNAGNPPTSQSNGTLELRRAIARLYPGADEENVLVTNGSSEANFVSVWSLVAPDDEVALMLPNYMQIWGAARGFGGRIRPFHLKPELGWQPDLDELRRAVTPQTQLIAVCNPNNPTGAVLEPAAMDAIIAAARASGAWLLCDEVYQGAERDGVTTRSFWGQYEKTIIVNGLSKAYALPGLRIGWIIAPKEQIARSWMHHDYLTIGPGIVSDQLACLALADGNREAILRRTRTILQKNYPIIEGWIEEHGDLFSLVPPRAGAIAYLKYHLDVNSSELAEILRRDQSVLIVPGDQFGMDHYLRIGYGPREPYLKTGLNRIDATLKALTRSRAVVT